MYEGTKALAALLDIAMFAHANGEEFESPITEEHSVTSGETEVRQLKFVHTFKCKHLIADTRLE